MKSATIESLAKTWIENWTNGLSGYDPKTSWLDLADHKPELCFNVILQALTMIPTEPKNPLFQTLSAGPLEELLALHGNDFIERVESLSGADSAFKLLLGNLWHNTMSEDVWRRVCKCRT